MEDSNLIDDNFNQGGLQVSGVSIEYIETAAKWARFLAIVGFVFIGLFVLVALIMGSFMANSPLNEAGIPIGFLSGLYIAMSALYFFPTLYLYRFATKALRAIRSDNNTELTESFMNLRNMFRFVGILTAIVIGIYAIGIVFAFFFGIGSAL